MGLLDLFRRKAPPVETRASGTGYTAAIMAARQSYISGVSDLAELTATVQACVSLWEAGLAAADVQGTDLLDRRLMALLGRALALRGEAVFLIRDGLVPVSDWDLSTVNGIPRAYRIGIPEAGGGRTETVLAAEVLHVRIGSDPVAPWSGTAPLRRASLSANLLHEIEAALRDTFRDAPFGSQTLPLPAITNEQMAQYTDGFRGRRGRTLLFAAEANGDMIKAPSPASLTPRLGDAETVAHLDAARGAIAMAFGVLPGLLNPATTGPMVREAQRHLATWVLQPMAELLAEEATAKLGGAVSIDVHRALQSFDAGGSARALAGIMQALATAKEAGLSDAQVAAAFGALDWTEARPGARG
jgi:hypothetical protein